MNTEKLVKSVNTHTQNIIDINSSLDSIKTEKSSNKFTRIINSNSANSYYGKGEVIVGDSISHGANVENIFHDSYVGVLRKMLNNEHGSTNIGFVSLVDKIGDNYKEIHSVSATNWRLSYPSSGEIWSKNSVTGIAYITGNAGADIVITVPCISAKFKILHYKGTDTTGNFQVLVNGVVKGTVSCNQTSGVNGLHTYSQEFSLEADTTGNCTIIIRSVGDGIVAVAGISYYDDANKPTLHNFSQAGRKICEMEKEIIEIICKQKVLLMNLGHNDQDLDGVQLQKTLDNIKYFEQYCKQYKTKLYVSDFIWCKDNNNSIRLALKQLCKNVPNATYIPFAEYFSTDGTVPTSSDLINVYKTHSDSSHPNIVGHKAIAETIAEYMKLSCISKPEAFLKDKRWYPLILLNGWENVYKENRYITAYQLNGNSLNVRLSLKANEGLANAVISKIPLIFFVPLNDYVMVDLHKDSNTYKQFAIRTYTYNNQNLHLEDVGQGYPSTGSITSNILIPINTHFSLA